MGAVYNTPHEAFPLLCSWQLCSNCQILTASKPKRTVTPLCIYVCPTSAHRGFRYGHRRNKINSFILKTPSFGRQSITSKLDLTLLNSDMSKKHTFACFFLAHPTFRVTRQSCSAYSHSLKYLSFLNPYALCFITFILLFIPSSLIVQIWLSSHHHSNQELCISFQGGVYGSS